MNLFVDTWAWLAVFDQKDPDHELAVEFLRRAVRGRERLVTTDYVLAETITLLFRRDRASGASAARALSELLEFLKEVRIRLERVTDRRFSKAVGLRLQYLDKPKISFTDFLSMVVMEEMGITGVVTRDSHFLAVNRDFQLLP
jgi:predicted nucleic acid-binding protein